MASYQNENRPDPGDLISWIVTIVLLVSPVWPIGLILLFRKLTRDSRRRRTSRHPYDMRREGAAPGTQGMAGRRPRRARPTPAAAPGRASR